jgi:hypothetical protein
MMAKSTDRAGEIGALGTSGKSLRKSLTEEWRAAGREMGADQVTLAAWEVQAFTAVAGAIGLTAGSVGFLL